MKDERQENARDKRQENVRDKRIQNTTITNILTAHSIHKTKEITTTSSKLQCTNENKPHDDMHHTQHVSLTSYTNLTYTTRLNRNNTYVKKTTNTDPCTTYHSTTDVRACTSQKHLYTVSLDTSMNARCQQLYCTNKIDTTRPRDEHDTTTKRPTRPRPRHDMTTNRQPQRGSSHDKHLRKHAGRSIVTPEHENPS